MRSDQTTEKSATEAPRSPAIARTRLRILDAAARCFAKSGFSRARMEDIAIAAGVSRARVYSYFGSKERLLQELADHMIEEWWDVGERAMAESNSFAEALATWIRNNLTDSRRRAALSALLNEEAWVFVANWEESSRRALRRWHTKLVELLRRGIEAGEFREDLDVESTADVMRAMQAGLIDHLVKARPSIDVSSERHVAAAIDVMVESLRRRADSR